MKDLPAIGSLYAELDTYLETLRSKAVQNGEQPSVARIEDKQRLNDQAYFVLCWGQLERAINDACRAAIRNKLANPNWSVRRAWDLYNPAFRVELPGPCCTGS